MQTSIKAIVVVLVCFFIVVTSYTYYKNKRMASPVPTPYVAPAVIKHEPVATSTEATSTTQTSTTSVKVQP